jgi:hypothetical protein
MARTWEALIGAVADALSMVTAEDCEGWFAHCGYRIK